MQGCRRLLTLGLALAVTGCSLQTTTSSGSSDTTTAGSSDTTDPSQLPPSTGRVGQLVPIQGQDVPFTIEVLSFGALPITSGDVTPPAGDGFFEVRVQFLNDSTSPYTDDTNGGTVVDDGGNSYHSTTDVQGGQCNALDNININVVPQSQQTICIPFVIRNGARIVRFVWESDSGFGQTADIRLR